MSEPGDDTYAAGAICGLSLRPFAVEDVTPAERERYGGARWWRWPLGGWSEASTVGILFMVGLVKPLDIKNSRAPVRDDFGDDGYCRCGCGWYFDGGYRVRAPGVAPDPLTLDLVA